jgi:X-X-X-Leu-X-X-Gly heptad repeat protein
MAIDPGTERDMAPLHGGFDLAGNHERGRVRRRDWRRLFGALLTSGAIAGSMSSLVNADEFDSPPPAPVPASAVPASPAHATQSTSVQAPNATGTYRLTLEDARQLAIANNTQLELGRLDVQEKQIAIRAAQTDYLPKILGSAAYLHFNEPLGTVVTTPGVILGAKAIAVNVVNENASYGMILAAQPITQLIGVSALVDLARADANTAAAQLDKGTSELVSGVSQAYTGLVIAKKIQTALALQIRMVEPLLKQKPTAELRLGLLEARKGLADVSSQAAGLTDTLNQLLGLAAGTELEVYEPILPAIPVNSADEAAQCALTNNPQICEAQQNILKAQAGMKAAKMDCLPNVAVVGGYVNQDFADYVQPNFGFVGVTASYTLLDWGKRSCVIHQRELQMMMANKNVQATAETVQLDARKAYQAYTQAQGELQIANEVVAASVDGVKEAKDLAAVMTAKSAAAKSELDLMKAELAFRLAQIKLLAAIGQQ